MKKIYSSLKKLVSAIRQRKNMVDFTRSRREHPVEPWAFIRVCNEIATVKACLESIQPVIKKGVIGYHKLLPHMQDDGTVEFIHQFCKENPGFIPFYYDHCIFPANDPHYQDLEKVPEENRIHSFYNAVFSQIPNGEWLIKIDADHVYDTEKLRQLMFLPKGDEEVLHIPKFNLHYEKETDSLYCISVNPVVNPQDHWLMKKHELMHFYLDSGVNEYGFFAWEMLNLRKIRDQLGLKYLDAPVCNWHFPCVKKTRSVVKSELIPFKEFRPSLLQRLSVSIPDDMLDEQRVLAICHQFNL